jgi:hypothetical protein
VSSELMTSAGSFVYALFASFASPLLRSSVRAPPQSYEVVAPSGSRSSAAPAPPLTRKLITLATFNYRRPHTVYSKPFPVVILKVASFIDPAVRGPLRPLSYTIFIHGNRGVKDFVKEVKFC